MSLKCVVYCRSLQNLQKNYKTTYINICQVFFFVIYSFKLSPEIDHLVKQQINLQFGFISETFRKAITDLFNSELHNVIFCNKYV